MIALVLGGASCLWDDLYALRDLGFPVRVNRFPQSPWPVGTVWVEREPDVRVVAVNMAGLHYPGFVDAWVSMHAEKFLEWRPKRYAERRNNPRTWGATGIHNAHVADRLIVEPWTKGASGLLATGHAVHQFGRAILCGLPQDDRPHFDARRGKWTMADKYQDGWRDKFSELRGCVRSMSGWTQEELGAPTRGWLDAKEAA